MTIDGAAERAKLGKSAISVGDWITIDGDSGKLFLGRRDTVVRRPEAELAEIARWRSQAGGSAVDAGSAQPRARRSALV
jgi:pyruvate,orthophosphate dikinase